MFVDIFPKQTCLADAKISLHADILQYTISVSESCFADDLVLVGYDAVSLGEQFLTFRRNLVPSSSWSSSPRRTCCV